MKLSNTILKPIVSEKSVSNVSDNKYTFKVNFKATKGSIAKDLKNIYDVDVLQVRTTIVPGKQKRILGTRKYSKTPKWKKAVVKLKKGQKIDLFPKE
jgi:large subunit ribosomal protein L23